MLMGSLGSLLDLMADLVVEELVDVKIATFYGGRLSFWKIGGIDEA